MHAWVRANRLDRQIAGTSQATIGIVTVGKAHHDAMHALRRLGLDNHPAIAVFKVAMAWPLEPLAITGVRPRQARHPRGRGKALPRRNAAPRRPLQPARPPRHRRQARRSHGADLLPGTLELSPELLIAALSRILPGTYGIPF